MAFVAVTYGFAYGKLTNSVANGEIPNLSPELYIGVILLAILLLVLMRTFLPTYTPQRLIFPKFYPLSKASKLLYIGCARCYKTTLFLSYPVYGGNRSRFLKYQPALILVLLLSTIFSTLFIRKLIQYPIDLILTKKGYLLNMGAIATVVAIVFALTKLNVHFLYSIVAMPFLLFYIGYLIEGRNNSLQGTKEQRDETRNEHLLKLLMNCSNLRAPLLMSTVLKVVFLFYFIIITKNQGHNDSPVSLYSSF